MRYFVLGMFCLVGSAVSAQQINTQVPFQTLNSSFFESTGVTWNLNGPGWFANFGGQTVPPFGNFDPNTGVQTGAAFRGNGVNGNIAFNFAQGSNRSITSTTPSLTTTDGVPGSFQAQTIRPFVTGISPVIGGAPIVNYPSVQLGQIPGQGGQMANAVAQSQRADFQRRIARSNDVKQKKALEYFNRGQRAEVEGNKKMARANYRTALAHAQGELRMMVIGKLRQNGWIR